MALPTYVFKDPVLETNSIVSDNAGNFYYSNYATNTIYKVNSAGDESVFYTGPTGERYGTLAFDTTFTYLYLLRQNITDGLYSIYKYQLSSPGSGNLVKTVAADGEYMPLCLDSTGNIYYPDAIDFTKVMKLTPGGDESIFCDLSSIPNITGIEYSRTISIYSTGGTSYMYVIYAVTGGDSAVAKIDASTGDRVTDAFISLSENASRSLLTTASGIFIIKMLGVLKYSYSGALITSTYVTTPISGNQFVTGCFDNAGSYLYIVYYTISTATYSIRTTKSSGSGGNVICFKEGSKILCLQGTEEEYVEIQNVRKNMLVKTSQSGYKRVDKVGTTVLYNDHSNRNCLDNLYICKKENYPELTEDLIMTGSHSILVDTMTDKQKETTMRLFKDIYVTENKYRLAACIDSRAKPYEVNEKVNIWHLSLEHTNKFMNYGIYANGLLVESASKRMMSEISGMKMV